VRKLTERELEKARLLKTARTAIRLKHALEADTEINEKLPAIEDAIDHALNTGTTYELDLQSVIES
jgi:hypothetical protein